MIPSEFVLLTLAALLAVVLMRALPRTYGGPAVAILSAVVLALCSWQSAVWLILGSVLNLGAMAVGDQMKGRTTALVFAITIHLLALLVLRDISGYVWIGSAYFTLRHIHVLSDWWLGVLAKPRWTEYAVYQLFLPVLAAGPIHRYRPFQQQLNRRRNDRTELLSGAERVLWGAFQSICLGLWLCHRIETNAPFDNLTFPMFVHNWAASTWGWLSLYLTFAGLSSIAVGLALMMGLRIEENFNAPWRARNLIGFWSRWHMSLTNFSKDYIFRPVAAATRSSVCGAFSAMIFLGVWHGMSLYWLCWGAWQGLGILLTVQARKYGWFKALSNWSGKLFAALWLSLTLPVITLATGATP
jgi:alginate O-acetyltransferase complex protein AlgI